MPIMEQGFWGSFVLFFELEVLWSWFLGDMEPLESSVVIFVIGDFFDDVLFFIHELSVISEIGSISAHVWFKEQETTVGFLFDLVLGLVDDLVEGVGEAGDVEVRFFLLGFKALDLFVVEFIDAWAECLLEGAFDEQLAGDTALLEGGLVVGEDFVEVSVLEILPDAFFFSLILAVILFLFLFEQISTKINVSNELAQRAVVRLNQR